MAFGNYDYDADEGRYSERLGRHAFEEDLDRSLDFADGIGVTSGEMYGFLKGFIAGSDHKDGLLDELRGAASKGSPYAKAILTDWEG